MRTLPKVWSATLDGRYVVEVVRVPPNEGEMEGYVGELQVIDTADENKVLLQERVRVSYGALFGPDISDVAEWEERVMKFVDERSQG